MIKETFNGKNKYLTEGQSSSGGTRFVKTKKERGDHSRLNNAQSFYCHWCGLQWFRFDAVWCSSCYVAVGRSLVQHGGTETGDLRREQRSFQGHESCSGPRKNSCATDPHKRKRGIGGVWGSKIPAHFFCPEDMLRIHVIITRLRGGQTVQMRL